MSFLTPHSPLDSTEEQANFQGCPMFSPCISVADLTLPSLFLPNIASTSLSGCEGGLLTQRCQYVICLFPFITVILHTSVSVLYHFSKHLTCTTAGDLF